MLVSNDLYSDYNKVLKDTKCKCVYIPNMIDIKGSQISKLNNKNLITVSRLSEEKGLYDLIDVIEIVKEKENNVKLNLIGDGILYSNLNKYIKDKNLDQNVNMLGFKESNEVYKIYKDSSLYVMTSFTESFGIVLLEAFSHGVPAVAFDSANGAKNLIKNNTNGILISNRNKKKMADEIVKLLNDKKLLKELSKNAINTSKEYLPAKVIPMWNNILQ